MQHFSRPRWLLITLVAGALSGGCGNAKVTPPAGQTGGGAGGPAAGGAPATSGGAPGASGGGPGFALPDAAAMPPPSAPPAMVPERQCAEEAHQAEVVPLDLLLLLDVSGSMDDRTGVLTKWESASTALRSFIRDPGSAGLGVGLQFFPTPRPCTSDYDCMPHPRLLNSSHNCILPKVCSTSGAACDTAGQPCPMNGGICQVMTPPLCRVVAAEVQCEQARYEKALVAIATLPVAEAALMHTLNRRPPAGNTPMGPAVRGALVHLRAHLAAHPGRKAALILISDGFGGGCGMDDLPDIAAAIGGAFMGSPSITTYVIATLATSPEQLMIAQMRMDQLAMAGGTTSAMLLVPNDDLNMRLQAALNQIRGAALACEYQIPAPTGGPIDFARVNVRYTGSAGPQNIPYVERADRCDPVRGGWYYDVPPTAGAPSRILVCDSTCRSFQAEQAGKVDLLFGCATRTIE